MLLLLGTCVYPPFFFVFFSIFFLFSVLVIFGLAFVCVLAKKPFFLIDKYTCVCVWLVLITYLCEALRISNSERPLVIGYDFAGYIDIGGESCGLFFLCADEKEGRKERERDGGGDQ